MTTRVDEAWSAIGDFTQLYRATMIRTHAADSYFFSIDDFRSMKLALGSELHLLISDSTGSRLRPVCSPSTTASFRHTSSGRTTGFERCLH